MFENHGIDNSKKKKHNCQWKTHASDPEDKRFGKYFAGCVQFIICKDVRESTAGHGLYTAACSKFGIRQNLYIILSSAACRIPI